MAGGTEGLEAWRSGDFETLERILDPDLEWRWFEPGEWDCRNREDVMRTLRERYDQGFAKGRLEFKDGRGRHHRRLSSERDRRSGMAGRDSHTDAVSPGASRLDAGLPH
jgi:hypothetical protein